MTQSLQDQRLGNVRRQAKKMNQMSGTRSTELPQSSRALVEMRETHLFTVLSFGLLFIRVDLCAATLMVD